MGRFVIEHLPRLAAQYRVIPLDYAQARAWIQQADLISLVRTTEMISAVEAAMGISLQQADSSMTLLPGDEALLIGLSFGVLLAWAQGQISPLPEDWRCLSLTVNGPDRVALLGAEEMAVAVEGPQQVPEPAR